MYNSPKTGQWQVIQMVESMLGNLKTYGSAFKSRHRETGTLYNQIPLDLYKIALTQIIKTCGTLASTVTLLHGGTLVVGYK